MNTEVKWIPLSSDLIAPGTRPSDANWIMESPSPYDVPTHTRAYYGPTQNDLTIEFKYISVEDVRVVQVSPSIQMELGRKSKRIYALHIVVQSSDRDKKRMAHEAQVGIESVVGAKEPNRHIALRALQVQQKSLFSEVAA